MKKCDLVRELANQEKTTREDAADQLDQAVNHVVRKLRHGSAARLPGLGTIAGDKDWTFRPARKGGK